MEIFSCIASDIGYMRYELFNGVLKKVEFEIEDDFGETTINAGPGGFFFFKVILLNKRIFEHKP